MSNVEDTQALAILADKVTEASGSSSFQVSAVTENQTDAVPKTCSCATTSTVDSFASVMEKFSKQLADLTRQIKNNSQFRRRQRSRFNSRDRSSRNKSKEGRCFYHRRFGTKATKCNEVYSALYLETQTIFGKLTKPLRFETAD